MRIAVSSAHSLKLGGASGLINEVAESRKVCKTVVDLINALPGETALGPFNDDTSTSVSANIGRIVTWHKAQKRDRDVSIHFNDTTGGTVDRAIGTECLYKSAGMKVLATQVAAAMASGGKLKPRGPKHRVNLGFLNNLTHSVLLEVCFVKSRADVAAYRENYASLCRAIASSLVGKEITTEPPPPVEPPPTTDRPTLRRGSKGDLVRVVQTLLEVSPVDGDFGPVTENAVKAFQQKNGLSPDGVIGPRTWARLEELYEIPPYEPPVLEWFEDIIATVFGGTADPNKSAYPPFDTITNTELSCSLPWKFVGKRQQVIVRNRANGKEVITNNRDVGPWLTDDDYFYKGQRPLAEYCWKNKQPLPRGPHKGKIPNGAGIDITPGTAKALGISGKGNVDWAFASDLIA
jgi:N-acetylmuramoyl-L-alanine amidase